MNLVKVCSKHKVSGNNMNELSNRLSCLGYPIHIQTLYNKPYLRWLDGLKTMDWELILDIFVENDRIEEEYIKKICPALELFLSSEFMSRADVYLASQIAYKNPINNAELITSCYLWNYETPPEERNSKMLEHFTMEQEQLFYDYVAFQNVTDRINMLSPAFDFFFEAHVSDPNGINEIYSKPSLGKMRKHSKAFLDIDTRLLSFGHVRIAETVGVNNGI